MMSKQGCKSLLSIGGDNLQFLFQFCSIFNIGGLNLDHDFFQVSKLSEEHKKGLHLKWNYFFSRIQVKTKKKVFTKKEQLFSPNSSRDLLSDARQS